MLQRKFFLRLEAGTDLIKKSTERRCGTSYSKAIYIGRKFELDCVRLLNITKLGKIFSEFYRRLLKYDSRKKIMQTECGRKQRAFRYTGKAFIKNGKLNLADGILGFNFVKWRTTVYDTLKIIYLFRKKLFSSFFCTANKIPPKAVRHGFGAIVIYSQCCGWQLGIARKILWPLWDNSNCGLTHMFSFIWNLQVWAS